MEIKNYYLYNLQNMSSFAYLNNDFKTDDDEKYSCIFYYGDKAMNPLVNGNGVIYESVSKNLNENQSLIELSKKGYLPQCEYKGFLYFIKK